MITYPFPNFNGCTVEVWEWICNFIPHFIIAVITYPCRDCSRIPAITAIYWRRLTFPYFHRWCSRGRFRAYPVLEYHGDCFVLVRLAVIISTVLSLLKRLIDPHTSGLFHSHWHNDMIAWMQVNIGRLPLTHWDRVTHICVSVLTIIGSDNGLSHGQC